MHRREGPAVVVRHSRVIIIRRTIKGDRRLNDQCSDQTVILDVDTRLKFFFECRRRWQAENYVPTHDKNVRCFRA